MFVPSVAWRPPAILLASLKDLKSINMLALGENVGNSVAHVTKIAVRVLLDVTARMVRSHGEVNIKC